MRQCVAYGLIAGVLTVALSGCGFFDSEEREPWRAQEEARCLASGEVTPSAHIRPMKEIKGPRVCGLSYPFSVSALGGGSVPLSKAAPLSCSMVPALEGWLREHIQHAAYLHFGMPVAEIRIMGSYNCRPMNHRKGANWSEHSFSNAIDVSGFKLLDGRVIDLKKDWKGGTPEVKQFLRDVHAGACDHFTTVLGPGSDALHYDHFHLDLRRHDPRGLRRVCKPVPVRTPSPHRMDPPMVRAPVPQSYPQAAVAQAPASPPPLPRPMQTAEPIYQQPVYPQHTVAAVPARAMMSPVPQAAPMPPSSDPIGMWIQQSDPTAVTPGSMPVQPAYPTSGGVSGIY